MKDPFGSRSLTVWVWVVWVVTSSVEIRGLHLTGTWNNKDFFLFLAKFGFQKTDPKDLGNTQGYIYGNITLHSPDKASLADLQDLTLVVVDSEYFLDFYGNTSLTPDKACPAMFKKIDKIAFDYICRDHGQEDFLRRIPCPKNKLCVDEDNPKNVVPGFQFTYKVEDVQRPRFWYVSIVSCFRNKHSDCEWKGNAATPFSIHYDIWLVNGNPSAKGHNPFEHQFSFEVHDVLEAHLIAAACVIFLCLLWLYVFSKQKHIVTKVFTACLCVKLTSIVLYLIHNSIFAYNGVGAEWLGTIASLLDLAAQCIFMLLLLLIAKGLGITTDQFKWKSVIFSMWAAYTLLNVFLYIWNLVEIDSLISNTDEWQSWPGYATLGFRLVVTIWFFIELKRTYGQTNREDVTFVHHFGAFFLVWFCYLPALTCIATQVSPLWRYKTIVSINYAVDILAYTVIIYLLWPARSILYLVEGERPLQIYDLEITGLLEDMNETILSSQEELDGDDDDASPGQREGLKLSGENSSINGKYVNRNNGHSTSRKETNRLSIEGTQNHDCDEGIASSPEDQRL